MSENFLIKKFKDKTTLLDNKSILVNYSVWENVSKFIYDSDFDYLMCITSYDLEVDNKLVLAYNFYSTNTKEYLEVRL